MNQQTMTISSARFGEVEVPVDDIIEFPRGLLGFENAKRFVLLAQPEFEPFGHLHSLDDPELSFIVVSPRLIFPHYKVEIDPREVADLDAANATDITVFVIVTVPETVSRMSANLQGPLLINPQNKRGKQVVLVHSPYTTCHYIEDELSKVQRPKHLDRSLATAP